MSFIGGTADALLHCALINRGVDGALSPALESGFALYSSRDDSNDSSSDDYSSSSDSGMSTMPSMDHNGDDSSISSSDSDSTDSSDDTMNRILLHFRPILPSPQCGLHPEMKMPFDMFEEDAEHPRPRKQRCSNRFGYSFGDYVNCNYCRTFFRPEVREVTYHKSRDKHSVFRSHFRVLLVTINDLTETFISKGWVETTQRCCSHEMLYIRTQLFIMCALEHLGNRRPHIQFTIETNMSYSEHRNFFALFINKMYSISPSYIYFPCILEALQQQIQ
jgi:hypothetical protein